MSDPKTATCSRCGKGEQTHWVTVLVSYDEIYAGEVNEGDKQDALFCKDCWKQLNVSTSPTDCIAYYLANGSD